MHKNKPGVFGIYVNRSDVENAVDQLKANGLKSDEISVFVPHQHILHIPHAKSDKAIAGAEVGIAAGSVVGGVLGWLAGVGLLAIPGIGAVIVAGPLGSALIAAGTLGSIGGLWGALVGMGIPEKEAKVYHERLHKGHILLSVHPNAPADLMKIKEIIIHTGAEDLHAREAQPAKGELAAKF